MLTWTVDGTIALVRSEPADYQPDTKVIYSDSNYILLGVILEKVSGQAVPEYLRTRILQPLALTGTAFPTDEQPGVPAPAVLGYLPADGAALREPVAPRGRRNEPTGSGGSPVWHVPDLGFLAIPQLPGGLLLRLSLTGPVVSWAPAAVDLSTALAGVPGILAPTDPEPEYVAINTRNQIAVTLQENNAIAVIDAQTGAVLSVFSAGSVSLSGIDTVEDDKIDLSGSLTDIPREPDAIAWIDDELLATANEGDLRGGTRGWSVFDARTGAVTWDAGNEFEHLAVRVACTRRAAPRTRERSRRD